MDKDYITAGSLINNNKPFIVDIHEMSFRVERLLPRYGFITFKFERIDKPSSVFNVVKLPDNEFYILQKTRLEQEILDAESLIVDSVKRISLCSQ